MKSSSGGQRPGSLGKGFESIACPGLVGPSLPGVYWVKGEPGRFGGESHL